MSEFLILEHIYEKPKRLREAYYEITIDITVGEYEHNEVYYFYGTIQQAHDWAKKYLDFIWGVETMWDESEKGWVAEFPSRAARLNGIRGPITHIQVELPDGKKGYAKLG